jgi:hypothetical protein
MVAPTMKKQKNCSTISCRAIGTLAMFLLSAMPLAAAESCGQVWLVNTRSAPLCGELEAGRSAIDYQQLGADCQWSPADAHRFQQGADATTPTVVFIHGNSTKADRAIEYGWRLYRRLLSLAGCRPFRLVIWSWPSERVPGGVRENVQIKAEYTDAQGYYLARELQGMRPDAAVSLIGYSYGARAATDALELLAGGSIAGRRLPPEIVAQRMKSGQRPYRLVLVAAAADADWLLPGHRNGLALSLTDGMLVTENAGDRVLRLYPRIYERCGPQAMGHDGPLCSPQPSAECDKICAIDVACSVGKRHDWHRYERAPELVERLPRYTFLDSPSGGP